MNADAYKLAQSEFTKDEMRLQIAPLDSAGYESRGAALALALRGRYAQEQHCWFLTPARAKKWQALYDAGFAAVLVKSNRGSFWRFNKHPDADHLELREAMRVSNGRPLGPKPPVEGPKGKKPDRSATRAVTLENELKDFGVALKKSRMALGLSQTKLAEIVGSSNKQLNHIEHGRNWPSLPIYLSLCRVLKVGTPLLFRDRG